MSKTLTNQKKELTKKVDDMQMKAADTTFDVQFDDRKLSLIHI